MADKGSWARFIAARIAEEEGPRPGAVRMILNRYGALPAGSALAREYEDYVLPTLAAAWSGHPDYRQECASA